MQPSHRVGTAGLCALVVIAMAIVPAGAKVTAIKYVSWYTGESTKSAIALFEKEYPSIDVQFSSPGDYQTKVITMASAGVMPDVIEMENSMVYLFGDPGLLEDMNQYIKRDKLDTGDFIGEYLKAFMYEGKLTAVPLYINSGALAYNQTMFQQAGVAYPDQSGKDHWDWTDLLGAAKKLTRDTNGDGKFEVYGWGEQPHWFYQHWLCQNSGRFFSLDLKDVMVDEPLAVEAFQFQADLVNVRKVAYHGYQDSFAGQKVAMFQGNSWMFPAWRKVKGLKFDLAPFQWQKKPYAELTANGLAISKLSKSKDAAWAFVKWMTSKTGQIALSAVPGFMPARLSVARSDVFMKVTPPEHNEYIIDMALRARVGDVSSILPNRVMDAFLPEFDKVIAGKTSAVEGMRKAAPVMQRALDDWNKRRLSRRK